MKKIILLSAVALPLLISACSNSSNSPASSKETTEGFDTTKLKTGDAYYQCSMHADVISDKPGKCPKCGEMELEKKEKK